MVKSKKNKNKVKKLKSKKNKNKVKKLKSLGGAALNTPTEYYFSSFIARGSSKRVYNISNVPSVGNEYVANIFIDKTLFLNSENIPESDKMVGIYIDITLPHIKNEFDIEYELQQEFSAANLSPRILTEKKND